MAKDLNQKMKDSVKYLRKEVGTPPQFLVVLSGGLQGFVESLRDVVTIQSADIPHFLPSTTEGHKGEVVFGTHAGKRVVALVGRKHYYEGLSMQDITLPVHALHEYGAKHLIITNAAGGINPSFEPGDLMVIRDHINFMGDNPLRGVTTQSRQFVDMTNAYTPSMRQHIQTFAHKQGVEVHEGVYLAVTGPSYETPAEIRAFRHLGADAVGMSTIPEVIVANFHRMQVLGVSCIANMAADLHPGGMNHNEVLKAVRAAEPRLVKLLLHVVERCGRANNAKNANAA